MMSRTQTQKKHIPLLPQQTISTHSSASEKNAYGQAELNSTTKKIQMLSLVRSSPHM